MRRDGRCLRAGCEGSGRRSAVEGEGRAWSRRPAGGGTGSAVRVQALDGDAPCASGLRSRTRAGRPGWGCHQFPPRVRFFFPPRRNWQAGRGRSLGHTGQGSLAENRYRGGGTDQRKHELQPRQKSQCSLSRAPWVHGQGCRAAGPVSSHRAESDC